MLATSNYRAEMDVVQRFIEDECEIAPNLIAQAGPLRNAYTKWCEENGERPLSGQDFNSRMEQHGFTRGRSNRIRFWEGLSA